VKYLDLYRRTKVNEAVFELLTKEYEIAKIQEAKEIPAAQVLDPATLPEKKSSPHRLLIMLWGALAGFVMASSYLIGQVVWKHTDDADPRKRLAQDVISTTAAWTDRTPFRRRVKTGVQRLSVWRPRPSNGRSG
jgi:G-rich domain on putative tyrosine kinase